jgi:hypothetical protein
VKYRARDLKWRGRELRLSSGRLLATTVPNGGLSDQRTDMCNISRAKDATISLAFADLNRAARPPPIEFPRPNANANCGRY